MRPRHSRLQSRELVGFYSFREGAALIEIISGAEAPLNSNLTTIPRMMFRAYVFVPFFAAAILALSACSDRPSASDIKKAAQKQMDSPMGQVMLLGQRVTVEEVRNLNCVQAAGKPGFVCAYDIVVVDQKTGRRDSGPAEARFVKSEGGWAVAQDR